MLNGKRKKLCLVLTVAACLVISITMSAHAGHKSAEPKTGILLVTFGTSVPEAQKAFKHIEEQVKAAFPDIPVRWAYTSRIIRAKLASQGQKLDSPVMALAAMQDEGFNRIAVQSLHTIPGEEYNDLLNVVQAFAHMPEGPAKIEIGTPLLYSDQDISVASEAILANIPTDRRPGDAFILMGHGTPHMANVYYPALQYYLMKKDPNVFLATVEGSPTLDDVIADCRAKGIKKAYVAPFMSVAGDHAINDMAGKEADSLASRLGAVGIETVPILKGTAEYDNMAAIWVGHLKDAVNRLE